jgi:hypothetical protein
MIPLSAGFYPFWFWNDTLTADEIRWQVNEMADKGVRGFFIHSRQGLGQPYLSESFFQMVDVAMAAAKAHGMRVHLYDEYPYPSGVAGGEVIQGTPQYRATRLVQRTFELQGVPEGESESQPLRLELPLGLVLSCIAYPLVGGVPDWSRPHDLRSFVGQVLVHTSYNEMGLTRYNRKRYFASEPTPVLETVLPPGPHRLYVSVQAEVIEHKYWDHFADVLNPEAVRRFIELTHERYAARYAGEFGGTLASIFVDETAPGWSHGLPAAFEDEMGYDLREQLPALQDPAHPDHTRVSYDLGTFRYRRFCESFEAQISSWCAQHGLAYSGEKPSVRLSQLAYMDIPGCEPGHTKVGAQPDWLQARLRSNAKATAGAAYFYGKSGALCECYHSTGWSATLQDAKAIADGLLLAGIRYLVPHGFFYSTHALKKHDAPPTFFYQMPFWPFFGMLSAYIDLVYAAFEGTYIDAEILLVDPGSGLPLHEDPANYPYLAAYETLLWALSRAHLDFHIVDTDILAAGQIRGQRIILRDLTARVVMVPAMPVIEPPLRDWLERFAAAGGVVIRCGVETEPSETVGQLLHFVGPSLSATVDGEEAGDLLLVKRVGPDRTLWFGFNTCGRSLDVRFQAPLALREVALDPARPPELRLQDGVYMRTVAPFASFLLEAVPVEAETLSTHVLPAQLETITVPVAGPARVRALNANLLRLGTWQMALKQPNGSFGPEAPVQGMPLANQLAASGLSFAPRFTTYFGHKPDLALPKMTVRYVGTFDNDYGGAVELVMEPGSIIGDWRIAANGSAPFTADDFGPTAAHVRGSLGIDITAHLVAGENTLTVEVTTDRLDGGLLNCLYLAGGFGVRLTPLGLVVPAREGRFEDYVRNLLPFYAGTVEYETHFDLPQLPPGDRVRLVFDCGEAACHEATEVAVNDHIYQPVLWEPRHIIVAIEDLRVGDNLLRTRLHTTLIRAFEGQWFDYTEHRYRDVLPEP